MSFAREFRPIITTFDGPPEVVLARLWRDVRDTKTALAIGRPVPITLTARGLLSSLGCLRVRVELAHAAAAFAEGLEERPTSREWVAFAVTARATLALAVRSGAQELAADLAELDESFEDAREAVLLLEPEDYREAVAGSPPDRRAWWGERARLDASLLEIDLERALGSLADG
jgi:hypothetical protein